MSRPGRVVAALLLAGLLMLGYGLVQASSGTAGPAPAPTAVPAPADPLLREISALQDTARQNPADYVTLARLGADYVAQAKTTADPAYYPKAAGVLERSLQINSDQNFQAMAGQAALKAAQHDFLASKEWARRGLTIDPYSATLYGSLNDAQTQLGEYDDAFRSAQKMLDLQPGVAALTRAEYVFELRGQLSEARDMLRRALTAAVTPADQAFVHQTASELAMSTGDPAGGLREAQAGLNADPAYGSLLQAQARAEAALGHQDAALRDYQHVVTLLPQPQYLVEYGEYLDSLGQHQQAREQYALFGVEATLFTTNGVSLDTDPTLFYADHGDPARALQYGQAGLNSRPFLEMQDAYAWALHANHRDAKALTYERQAMALGTRNALFSFHTGMIEKALGQRTAAVSDLRTALAINPHFNPLQVPVLGRALTDLGSGA